MMVDEVTYKISDFDYELPQELIAQTPIEPRDASRLLVVHRDSGIFEHRHFPGIGDYLRPGDLLIANQSRVLPARLLGHRAETGGAVEVLLQAERCPDLGRDYWETLVRPGRRLREGSHIVFGNEAADNAEMKQGAFLQAEVLERTEASGRIVRFRVEREFCDGTRTDRAVGSHAVASVYSRDIAAPGAVSDGICANYRFGGCAYGGVALYAAPFGTTTRTGSAGWFCDAARGT